MIGAADEQQMPLLIEVGTPYHRSYHDPSSSKCLGKNEDLMTPTAWWFGTFGLFSHILGMSLPQLLLTHIF